MMPQPTSQQTQKSKSLFKAIFLTGLLAGTLDAIAASLNFWIKTGKSPIPVWQYVASGVFGKNPEPGGYTRAAWGLFFHFCIAFLFTIFFFWIYPKIKFLSKNAILTGLLYGSFVWLIMNLVVVPLSNTPKLPFNLSSTILGIAFMLFCIGLPISIIAKKHFSGK